MARVQVQAGGSAIKKVQLQALFSQKLQRHHLLCLCCCKMLSFLWTTILATQAVLLDVGMSPAAQSEQPTGKGIAKLGPPRSAPGALAGLKPCPGASSVSKLRQRLKCMDSCLSLQTNEAPYAGQGTQPVRPVLTKVVPVLQACNTKPQPFHLKCDTPTLV